MQQRPGVCFLVVVAAVVATGMLCPLRAQDCARLSQIVNDPNFGGFNLELDGRLNFTDARLRLYISPGCQITGDARGSVTVERPSGGSAPAYSVRFSRYFSGWGGVTFETRYEGALRVDQQASPPVVFMTGTYYAPDASGQPAVGPHPFCAHGPAGP